MVLPQKETLKVKLLITILYYIKYFNLKSEPEHTNTPTNIHNIALICVFT